MRRGLVSWSAGVLFLLSGSDPEVAQAGEVKLGLRTRAGYDSNVFSRAGDETDTGVFTVNVQGDVSDTLERGSYRVHYEPAYSYNLDSDADDTWNHRASATGSYYFTPRTSINASDSFSFIEKARFAPGDPDSNPNFNDQNRRTIRNTASLQLAHSFTKRMSASASAAYTIYRLNGENTRDSDGISGQIGGSYALSRRLRIGGGGSFRYSLFDGTNPPTFTTTSGLPVLGCFGQGAPRGRTVNYSAYGLISFVIDDQSSISIQGGPARIETSNYSCSGSFGLFGVPADFAFVPREYEKFENDTVTWFAAAEIQRRWQRLQASLRYRRSEGLGNRGDASINDSVIVRGSWKAAKNWSVDVRGGYVRRDSQVQSASRSAGTSSTWTASGGVNWRLAQRLTASADLSYRTQSQKSGGQGDFDAWRAFTGLKYDLDPIRY